MSMYSSKADLKRGNILIVIISILLVIVAWVFNVKLIMDYQQQKPIEPQQKTSITFVDAGRFISIDTDEWFCANETKKGECTTWQHFDGLTAEN